MIFVGAKQEPNPLEAVGGRFLASISSDCKEHNDIEAPKALLYH